MLRRTRPLVIPGAAPSTGRTRRCRPRAERSGSTAPDEEPAVGDSFRATSTPGGGVDSANAHEQLRSRAVPPPAQIRQMVEATTRRASA
ncbi:hypothetical protein QJS66_05665 [Kocuria rhizophila]|nr:hypothetical protein QJS66_05665 [Kocuria rhizophila]